MNLQSYFATADIASLDEGELPGLVPFLIGRPLDNEVAVIATSYGRPYMLRTIPLDGLGDTAACGIAAAYWAQPAVDAVWLVGHGTDTDDAAAALDGLTAALAPQGLSAKNRQIVLDPTCRNWRYAFEDDELDWGPIHRPDPVTGRFAALAFHAACIATREAEAFAPRRSRWHRDTTFPVQEHMTKLRDRISTSGMESDEDRQLLEDSLDYDIDGSPLEEVTLIDLGIALAASTGLLQRALAVIWESEDEVLSGFSVWSGIARNTHGRVRAIGCALAALAAWRHEDPLAPIAAREALAADNECALAQAVSAIVTSGALASNFDDSDHLRYLAESAPTLDEIEGMA